jgi:hypothetical protein
MRIRYLGLTNTVLELEATCEDAVDLSNPKQDLSEENFSSFSIWTSLSIEKNFKWLCDSFNSSFRHLTFSINLLLSIPNSLSLLNVVCLDLLAQNTSQTIYYKYFEAHFVHLLTHYFQNSNY